MNCLLFISRFLQFEESRKNSIYEYQGKNNVGSRYLGASCENWGPQCHHSTS